MDLFAVYAVVLAILVSLSEVASGQYNVDSVILSTNRARVGDNLSAVCEVRNDGQTRILVYWVRKIHEHDHEVEISTNGVMNDNFKQSGRYSSHYETVMPRDIRRVRFYLNITNVKTEDSGQLGCRLTGPENERFEVFKDFIVSVPVQKVTWISSEANTTSPSHTHVDGSAFELREDVVKRFVCHVNGSFPKPQVHVYIGDRDITSQFKQHAVLVKGGGPPGLQPLYYKVDVSNDALKVDYSVFNDKALRCAASLPNNDIPSTVDPATMQMSSSINITLLYKPKFQCSMKVFTRLNEPNYDLICKVHSNPEVKLAKVHWNDPNDTGNDTDSLEDGMKSGDYEANVTMVSELETVMVLTISRVYKQHFKTYIFEAENDLGRVTHEVELREEILRPISHAPVVTSHVCFVAVAASLAVFLTSQLSKSLCV